MALIHRAELVPSKRELLAHWLPGQGWLGALDVSTVELIGAYRFDDPAGEVGIETHLARLADGAILQLPVTYRGTPLPDAEEHLIGTMEHSVLGSRWVYDGVGDPVYLQALLQVIVHAGHEAEEQVATDSGLQSRRASVQVRGSGGAGVEGDLVVHRHLDPYASGDATVPRLTGTWLGQDEPVVLAELRR